ncbi:hypothetical protein [Catenibacterium sp.]|uniref:hypothetical protein n=1 Tax=Catenibacterium sp. TaxID=2049022 RepID=UPI00399571CF
MDLLDESRGIWLSSFIICTLFPIILHIFAGKSIIGRTIRIQFIQVQIVVFVFFIYFIFADTVNRAIPALVYLIITLFSGKFGIISKWYIIIPVFIITELYLLWNLGGVKNCLIASPYKEELDKAILSGHDEYNKYAAEIDEYNKRNNLDFFTRVRIKREPNWNKWGFNSSGYEMFEFGNALAGLEFSTIVRWEKNEERLREISKKMYDKHEAVISNAALHDEKDLIDKIVKKKQESGLYKGNIDCQKGKINGEIQENMKKEKKILRRRF